MSRLLVFVLKDIVQEAFPKASPLCCDADAIDLTLIPEVPPLVASLQTEEIDQEIIHRLFVDQQEKEVEAEAEARHLVVLTGEDQEVCQEATHLLQGRGREILLPEVTLRPVETPHQRPSRWSSLIYSCYLVMQLV